MTKLERVIQIAKQAKLNAENMPTLSADRAKELYDELFGDREEPKISDYDLDVLNRPHGL